MNNVNTVELLGFYGGDMVHAQSAWTSTSRTLTDDKIKRIPDLLKMLATNGHHTPFEKSSLHFLVTTDISTHIQLLKHRIGVSINAESARYKELKEDKYLLPRDWPAEWQEKLQNYTEQGNILYHKCLSELTETLGRKRAKESARLFKTYNSQIAADVMFNYRSFYHFQLLRNSPDAQLEIRDLAQQMLDIVKGIDGNPFEHTIVAFEACTS
jgi:thymidylate synthase (FAD)